MYSKADKIR